MKQIVLRGVCKSFDERRVLDSVSHVFEPGSVTALSGRSGSGKTTLLNIIMGLMQPDSGQVLGAQGLRLGVVFQEDRLIEQRAAHANVQLVCPSDISDAEIDRHLQEVGLGDEQKKPVLEFSGGMRRRVALVRALIVHPELLILDEPFKGLDAELRDQVIRYIGRYRAGAITIVATHDPEDTRLMGAQSRLTLDAVDEDI